MSERNLYEVTGDIKDINTMLVSREEWNRRAQPAQAGQAQDLMALIDRYWELAYAEGKEGRDHDTVDGAAADCRRAIKQAVLAKRVPMTESAWQNPLHPDQISDKPIPNWTPLYRLMSKISDPSNAQHFSAEAAVKAFGIVGEKGGA